VASIDGFRVERIEIKSMSRSLSDQVAIQVVSKRSGFNLLCAGIEDEQDLQGNFLQTNRNARCRQRMHEVLR
jgi:hypothetical protein